MHLYTFTFESIVHKIEGQAGSASTQVATTAGTYHKSGEKMKHQIPPDGKILSYGAGLEHTTHALKKGLGGGDSHHIVHDYEPFPEKRKEAPTFKESTEIPKNHYHGVVSHNWLRHNRMNV